MKKPPDLVGGTGVVWALINGTQRGQRRLVYRFAEVSSAGQEEDSCSGRVEVAHALL